jgi:hypothetical protein
MKSKKGLIVVMGHENDEKGELSEVANKRALKASNIAKEELNNYLILPTGGFGEYFNKSNTPHGKIIAREMIKNGVNGDRLLNHTNTSGTVEDAYATLRRLKEIRNVENVCIVTSEFHMKRVKYIFSRVLQDYNLDFEEAENPDFGYHERDNKIKHENKRIEDFKNGWVNVSGFDLEKESGNIHSDLLQELQHYDRYSYLALAGAFFSASFGLSWGNAIKSPITTSLTSVFIMFLVVLFGLLYYRLARTANSARRTLEAVEIIYGHPGISWTNLEGVPGIASIYDPSVGKTVVLILALLILGLLVNAVTPWI